MRSSSSIQYEPHVDGLRSLAVLSVILFHADKNWLPGGFVGVDIFFVISGYLITKIISKDIAGNGFSFLAFYTRRIKRILPLYLTILLVTTGVGLLILLPADLEHLIRSGISSLLFFSNLYFWYTSDYFAAASENLPLLHTWSLAVEEQYYIFWPAILIYLARYSTFDGRKLLVLFGVLLFACIAVSEYLVQRNLSFAYYALPGRAYELLIGACLAVVNVKHPGKAFGTVLSITGLVLVGGSLFLLSARSPFPGITALAPTLGAGLLILGGRGNSNPVQKVFSSKLLVGIGLLSYSLYLWHWPVFAFARYLNIEFTPVTIISLLGLIGVLSYASYVFIEQPFIRSTIGFRKAFGFVFLLPLAGYSGLFALASMTDGFYQRYDEGKQNYLASMANTTDKLSSSCLGEHQALNLSSRCVLNPIEGQEPTVALWGDSHGNHFRPMLEILLKDAGIVGREFSFWGCPPAPDLIRVDVSFGETCRAHNARVLNYILENNYSYVVIAARWRGYINTGIFRSAQVFQDQELQPLLANSLDRTIRMLEQRGIRVILLESVPTYPFNPSACEIKNEIYPNWLAQDCRLPITRYEQDEARVREFIRNLKGRHAQLQVVPMQSLFCYQGYCRGRSGNSAIYRDQSHVTVAGSSLAGEALIRQSGNPLLRRPESPRLQ